MSEGNQESRRLEDWLTGGRPVAIRARGTIRPRAQVTGIEVKQIKEVSELLQQLKEELPDVPWIVVVDGRPDPFAEKVCRHSRETQEDCRFWLVDSEDIKIPDGSPLASLDILRLNPLNKDDSRFMENLVADLVIIPSEPKDSQRMRIERWLHQSRYILYEAKKIDDSVIHEIQSTGYLPDRSNASMASSP